MLNGGTGMTKNVQMSIKMESELHEQFMAAVAATHTPAAQVVRQLMRKFISLQETPNALTIAAMQSADRGEGTRFESADSLFKDLGI
jgi:antitoxin component of RelBE/YafQ-DinJ toxin-antitoxin module